MLEPGDPRHGTDNGYTNLGCRCAWCTAAHKDAKTGQRKTGTVRVHSRIGYSNGCRCPVCREGHRVYMAERRKQAAA
jgi:hypothetical protein